MMTNMIAAGDGDTLLTYALQADPDPPRIGGAAGLTLIVSNMARHPITCTKIVLTIPVGTGARDLVADTTALQTTKLFGWNIDQSGGTITFHCEAGAAIGDDGLSFGILDLAINDQPGTAKLDIDETAARDGGQSQTGSTAIEVAKFPAEFHLGELTANPVVVAGGGSTTLMWTGSVDATYTIEYQPHDDGTIVQQPVGAVGPYAATDLRRGAGVIFTLTATTSQPGSDEPLVVQRQVAVEVDVLSLQVAVEPPSVGPGGLVRLRWNAPNANHCVLDDGSVQPAVGSVYYVVSADREFTVLAYAPGGGSLQAQAAVTVETSIVPTEPGYSIVGAQGPVGGHGANGSGLWSDTSDGGPGGVGGDGILQQSLPPLDTIGHGRVIPIQLTGGKGGTGGAGGIWTPWPRQDPFGIRNSGQGGQGGRAVLDVTLDHQNATPAQYIVTMTPGPGGDGGPGQKGGTQTRIWGQPGSQGPSGSISATIDGLPLTFRAPDS
jgi:hypothetical protein